MSQTRGLDIFAGPCKPGSELKISSLEERRQRLTHRYRLTDTVME